MPKILLPIGMGIIVIAFSFIALGVLVAGSRASANQPVDLRETVALPLHLPLSLIVTVGIIGYIGPILIAILTGTIVGGEYGVGTIRVLLTRGPTRTQYLLAKTLALLACITITMVILIPLGIIVGALYNLFIGIHVDFTFFTADWTLHAIAYILLAILHLFIYAIIALSLATLGKSTAAGIAGGLLWWFLEGVFTNILAPLIASFTPSATGDFVRTLPDYLVGNNIGALLTEQSDYLTPSLRNASSTATDATSTIPDWRAWLVIAIYFVVFLGTTWWVSQKRDITN
jgi:ABC-type transport system involved in multi-copper enzyme maturation permease subunit